MKIFYPAVFETAEEGGYTVQVPDLPGCITEGDTLEEAMWMAQDAIGSWLFDVAETDYPPASGVNDIDTSEYKDFFVTLVEFDSRIYEERCHALQRAKAFLQAEQEDLPLAATA